MLLGKPKTFHFTFHSREKMRQYRLSDQRVRRILNSPDRVEEGIAPETSAAMQKSGSVKHPNELWVMIQDSGETRKIISAWRYPGETKPRSEKLKEILMSEINEYFSESMDKYS